jgi:CheY-like chemotaxis protein
MTFSLHRRPGGIIFLDDDPDYLEMLAEVMPAQWYVRLLLRPVECIQLLMQEIPQWESDAWRHQEIINHWRDGKPLIPQILKYWKEDGTARFSLTQVCVVDYAMPAMSGLQVLSELTGWTGSRVLLTGRVEEQLAVSAFNRGLIERFVPKQSPDLRLRLTKAIQSLLDVPDPRHQQTWRATLSREQHALLCNPVISQELDNLALREGWIEHIVIGAPFGALALDSKGSASWLQLESSDKLPELAEMAESEGWDRSIVEDVRTGKKLIDLELQLALGSRRKPRPQSAFSVSGEVAILHAALFKLEELDSSGGQNSHDNFIASLGKRTLLD